MNVCYKSPIGWLGIRGDAKAVLSVDFLKKRARAGKAKGQLRRCLAQIDEYFKGKRKRFSVKFRASGTPFEQKVWKALARIPCGVTASYKQVARRIGSAKAVRAVARAAGKNPVALLVPCHRMIGSDGRLTGYSHGLKKKAWLLNHENAPFGGTVSRKK